MNKSKSSTYIANSSPTPLVSSTMAKQVSHYRRAGLEQEVEQGLFRDGSAPTKKPSMPLVTASYGISKNAQVVSGAGGGFRGPGDSLNQSPEVYSPLWLTSNASLPRDRATMNAWCRSITALNPIVGNAINLHSTYPISKLNIKCANKEVEKFFNEMIEEIDLMNICVQIAQEYWTLGEAFVYADFDQTLGKWSRLVIQNPDFISVKRAAIANEPIIMLRPDENLKRIVSSNKPADIEQKKHLGAHIVDSVKRGQNIILNNFNISHLARKISPYEIRGTGLPVCIFRSIMLFDKLKESKNAQAENMINPLTVIKVGGEGNDALHPSYDTLEAYRSIFENAQSNKDFKIFTHAGVTIEKIGSGAGIYDTTSDFAQLMKEIYIGLQVPQVLMDGGADTSYANGGVALDVLRQRYMQFRNMLAIWLRRKIFAPISKIQEFYEYKTGKKELIVPEVDWNHMSLFDTGDYITTLVTLTSGEGDAKRASLHTLYKSIGLEYEDEVRKRRKEAIQDAIFEKEKVALQAMDLDALRALDEDDEIKEPIDADLDDAQKQAPLPGESNNLPTPPEMTPPSA
jgi:hypothetical protein